jgi:hypothetical protein
VLAPFHLAEDPTLSFFQHATVPGESSETSTTDSALTHGQKQILEYALGQKDNKTKFRLIFANITEADILLREEFDAWKKAHPNTFDVTYVLDKPDNNWKGEKTSGPNL